MSTENNEQNQNKRRGRRLPKALVAIISTVCAVAVAVGGFFAVHGLFGDRSAIKADIDNKLATVTNITYSMDQRQLGWDPVQNADRYYVEFGGADQQKTDTNSMYYLSPTKSFSVRVKASDSTGKYADSDWSETATFTDQREFSYSAIAEFIGNAVGGNVEAIKSIYQESEKEIYATIIEDGEICRYMLTFKEPVTLQNFMTGEVKRAGKINAYNVSTYNAMDSLIKSNKFAGQLEEYRQDGWKVEGVSGTTSKFEGNKCCLFGIFKLTKDGETKYIYSELGITLVKKSPYEGQNYSYDIEDPNNTRVFEEGSHELTPEEVQLMEVYGDLGMAKQSCKR